MNKNPSAATAAPVSAPIGAFNRQNIRLLQDEAFALLAPLREKYGVDLRIAGGTFSETNFTMKFEAISTSEEAEKAAFAKDAPLFGCQASDYGRLAVVNGKECKLIGFALNRSKFPVRVRETATGKTLLLVEDVLNKRFHTGRPPVPALPSFPLPTITR